METLKKQYEKITGPATHTLEATVTQHDWNRPQNADSNPTAVHEIQVVFTYIRWLAVQQLLFKMTIRTWAYHMPYSDCLFCVLLRYMCGVHIVASVGSLLVLWVWCSIRIKFFIVIYCYVGMFWLFIYPPPLCSPGFHGYTAQRHQDVKVSSSCRM